MQHMFIMWTVLHSFIKLLSSKASKLFRTFVCICHWDLEDARRAIQWGIISGLKSKSPRIVKLRTLIFLCGDILLRVRAKTLQIQGPLCVKRRTFLQVFNTFNTLVVLPLIKRKLPRTTDTSQKGHFPFLVSFKTAFVKGRNLTVINSLLSSIRGRSAGWIDSPLMMIVVFQFYSAVLWEVKLVK